MKNETCDNAELIRLNEALKTVPVAWQHFEDEVIAQLEREIEFCKLGLNPKTAIVRKRPKYFSKDRGSDITFDASIEVSMTAGADRPLLIWLWECKDYPDRNVSVDEIEEFHHKLTQVGAHKGTVVTRKGFASGGVALAKSRGIGLMTLRKEEIRYLAFSRDAGILRETKIAADMCLYSFGEEVSGPTLGTLMQREIQKADLMKFVVAR